MRKPSILFALCALVPGCARVTNSARPLPLAHRDTTRVFIGRWAPGQLGPGVGIDSLHRQILPPGYSEIRVELLCDLCTPRYLLRLVQQPGTPLHGEAYLELSRLTDPSDTTEVRIHREYSAWARQLRRQVRCGPLLDTPPPEANEEYCLAQRQVDWGQVLHRLEQSGALRAATEAGYFPQPWLYASGDSTAPELRRRHCNDEGGRGLTIEVLEDRRYRTAHFWCLEVPGPESGEHGRMAHLYAELHALVVGSEDERSSRHDSLASP